MFNKFWLLITSASLLVAISVVIGFAADDTPSNSKDPVATIFDKTIYADQLNPPDKQMQEMKGKLKNDDYNAWLIKYRGDHLFEMIWNATMDDYLLQHHISVTQEEIDAFSTTLYKQIEEDNARREKERKDIMEQLKSGNLSKEQKDRLSERLKTLNSLKEFDERRKNELQSEERRTKVKEINRKADEDWIKRWKFNKALYEQYKGRVIFQQAGLEPIDAFRMFLKEREEKKLFQIFDSDLQKPIQQFYERTSPNSQNNTFASEKDAKFYFEKPYWLRTMEEMKSHGF
jgi:hypothetical protein